MKRIWKWTLEVTDRQRIPMPRGAEILAVQMQGHQWPQLPQLLALCDPDEPRESREIAIYGTGNPVPDNPGRYISTFQMVQMAGGSLVWHAFEVERA